MAPPKRTPLSNLSNTPLPPRRPHPHKLQPPRFDLPPPHAAPQEVRPPALPDLALPASRDSRASGPCCSSTAMAHPAEGTPSRLGNAMEEDPAFSTPQHATSAPHGSQIEEQHLPLIGDKVVVYGRRERPGGSNLTMSCPPLGRSSLGSVADGIRQKHVICYNGLAKAAYDFPVEAAVNLKGMSKRASNSRRRRSLPETQSAHNLPENFVLAQRSHFAEVDAFELLEEEALSEGE